MATQFQPLSGCQKTADALQTALASSVCHLFKSDFVPTPSDVVATYAANEADYTGYAAKTMTTWNEPILSPGEGYMIVSPLVQFDVGLTDPAVGNVIGGCYLLDAAGALRQTIIFTTPIPMQLAGQGIPITITIEEPVS